jgi:hypothetical protein
MPLNGLPLTLERLLDALLQENAVSSFRVDCNSNDKTTVILRLSPTGDDAMAADTLSTATYRRKSQAQINRDRKRAENHRAVKSVTLLNDQSTSSGHQASDFRIASSNRTVTHPPPSSDLSVCQVTVNKPACPSDPVKAARATRGPPVQQPKHTAGSGVRVKSQQPAHQPVTSAMQSGATREERSDVGLCLDDNYRSRLRSASRIGLDTDSDTQTVESDEETLQKTITDFLQHVQQQSDNLAKLSQDISSCTSTVSSMPVRR